MQSSISAEPCVALDRAGITVFEAQRSLQPARQVNAVVSLLRSRMYSSLDVTWATRVGGGGRTEQRYLDFVIDGVALCSRFDVDAPSVPDSERRLTSRCT